MLINFLREVNFKKKKPETLKLHTTNIFFKGEVHKTLKHMKHSVSDYLMIVVKTFFGANCIHCKFILRIC